MKVVWEQLAAVRDVRFQQLFPNRCTIKFMSKSSSLSSKKTLRRQPQQKRGQQRVEKILVAAAEVFAEAGFAAATIQQIADRANTAVGSIYQFFPDKVAIFHALFTRHLQQVDIIETEFFQGAVDAPIAQKIDAYLDPYISYFEQPIPRCILIQAYLQPIEGLAVLMSDLPGRALRQIDSHAHLYRQRNPDLSVAKSKLLAEVLQHMCISLFLHAMQSDLAHRQEIYAEIKNVLYVYLNPHIGDHLLVLHSQKMMCPECQSDRVVKNGHLQGKQRYICRGCGRQFVDDYTVRGYPLDTKQRCLDLHQQGMSFREIERSTGVNHNTVINWVKNSQRD
jgi:AcrR family transcriptional regulator/transposase-like protein